MSMFPAMPAFPDRMFPATTIVGRVSYVDQEGGDTRPVPQEFETIMGSVQDATADEVSAGQSSGYTFDTIIYYPARTKVNPGDSIEWVEPRVMYRVVAERQESSFGLLWAVYCKRAG